MLLGSSPWEHVPPVAYVGEMILSTSMQDFIFMSHNNSMLIVIPAF